MGATATGTVNLSDVIGGAFYGVHNDISRGLHSEYWEKGGRASLKSSFISAEIILGLERDRNANAICYRRVGATLKDSVYAQLLSAIRMMGLEDYYTAKSSPLEIVRKYTGQRILFRGADDPLKSKSIKLSRGHFGFLWFEELAEFRSMEDVRTIRQSIIRGSGTPITFYSYNPPRTSASWVNAEALVDVPGRNVHHTTYLQAPPSWIGEAFIADAEALKKSNPRAYANEYLGEVTGNGGNVFENLTVRPITDAEIKTLAYFVQGIDWGYFPDPFAWVRCAFDVRTRRLWILDEYVTNKKSNRETFDAIKGRLSSNEELTADSAEEKSIADYRAFGAPWIRAAVKGPGSVAYSTKWLASLAEIIIDPKCKTAVKEFTGYEYERNAQGEYIDGFVDRDNHCLTGDTLVDTIFGQMQISELCGRSGTVKCFDEDNGHSTFSEFSNVRKTGRELILEIVLDDGRKLKCTADHLILTRNGWKRAIELNDLDEIVDIGR